MIRNQIVVHYQNRSLLKGFTSDFFPNKDLFHLALEEAAPGANPVEVRIAELKCIFFVKDFTGNPQYNERKEFDPSARVMGRKIRVHFKDGEEIIGTTQGYQPGRSGFFVVPADPQSNNERCYVVSSAAAEVTFV